MASLNEKLTGLAIRLGIYSEAHFEDGDTDLDNYKAPKIIEVIDRFGAPRNSRPTPEDLPRTCTGCCLTVGVYAVILGLLISAINHLSSDVYQVVAYLPIQLNVNRICPGLQQFDAGKGRACSSSTRGKLAVICRATCTKFEVAAVRRRER